MTEPKVPESLRKHFENDFVTSPVLETLELGHLSLPSGRLVICDPLLTAEMPALDVVLPPGNYPVLLHIERETGCVAYAELSLQPGQKVKSWQMAHLPGQNLSALKKEEIYGFGVESGLGMMMDPEAQKALSREELRLFDVKGNDFLGLYEEVLEPFFRRGDGDYAAWAMVEVQGQTMAGFATGYGPGFYASWIGRNVENEVVRIVCELVEIG